jgi:hypothetical protein
MAQCVRPHSRLLIVGVYLSTQGIMVNPPPISLPHRGLAPVQELPLVLTMVFLTAEIPIWLQTGSVQHLETSMVLHHLDQEEEVVFLTTGDLWEALQRRAVQPRWKQGLRVPCHRANTTRIEGIFTEMRSEEIGESSSFSSPTDFF